MARSLNKVFLLGNVGQDPKVHETATGKKVATLSVATSPPWNENETNWHRVVGWEKVAEIIEAYVSKGDLVHIVGRIRYSTYDKGGETRYSTEIVIEDLTLLGKRSTQGQASAPSDEDAEGYPWD